MYGTRGAAVPVWTWWASGESVLKGSMPLVYDGVWSCYWLRYRDCSSGRQDIDSIYVIDKTRKAIRHNTDTQDNCTGL